MDSNVFDKNVRYLDRFIANQGKKYDFPNFKYEDVRFHPTLKDHIIVLSKTYFPKDLNVSSALEGDDYDLNGLEYKWPSQQGKPTIYDLEGIGGKSPFDYAVSETVKKYKLKFYEEGVVVEEDLPAENQQPADEDLKKETDDKVKQLEEATKQMNDLIDKDDDNSDYEGGSSEDEKSSRKSNKEDKKDSDKISEKAETHKSEARSVKSSKTNRSKKSKKSERPSTAKVMPYEGDENEEKKSTHPKSQKSVKSQRSKHSEDDEKRSSKSQSKEKDDSSNHNENPKSRSSKRSHKTTKSKESNKSFHKSNKSDKSNKLEEKSNSESHKKLIESENEETKSSKPEKIVSSDAKNNESDSDDSILALKKKDNTNSNEAEVFNQDKLKTENEDEKHSEKESDKDERRTQTPIDNHNEETKGDAESLQSINPEDKPKDNEEDKPIDKNEPKIELQLTSTEKFKKLTKEQQQEIVNYTVDLAYKYKPINYMCYHGYDKKFLPDGWDVQTSDYKLRTENFTYSNEHYITNYFKKKFNDIEYQPHIIRNTYQISIWKYDQYGCVKIKDKYFSSKFPRTKDADFMGFEITEDLNGSNILITEKSKYGGTTRICFIINPYSLEIVNELELLIVDPDFNTGTDGYSYYDNYYDYTYSS